VEKNHFEALFRGISFDGFRWVCNFAYSMGIFIFIKAVRVLFFIHGMRFFSPPYPIHSQMNGKKKINPTEFIFSHLLWESTSVSIACTKRRDLPTQIVFSRHALTIVSFWEPIKHSHRNPRPPKFIPTPKFASKQM
jgi:hypothetical protein